MSSVQELNYRPEQLNLISKTYAKDCNKDEFNLFINTCAHRGLDPFKKEIYAQVFNKNDESKRNLVMVIGIDGLRKIAESAGNYRPDTNEPEYIYNKDLKTPTNPLGIERVSLKVFKQDSKGEWFSINGTAYWEEFAPAKEIWEYDNKTNKKRPSGKFELSSMWKKMPRLMIAKCAEAQALRKGWSAGASLYSHEELESSIIKDVTPSDIADKHEEEKRIRATNSIDSIFIQWTAGESIMPEPVGTVGDKLIKHINTIGSTPELNAFKDINQLSMRAYWAKDPSGALEVKKVMEAKQKTLEDKENIQGNELDNQMPEA